MASADTEIKGGFSFINVQRNAALNFKGLAPPKATKTGTTIVGCIYGNGTGVVLGADTRATAGSLVADKNCEKIHRIANRIYCCGAGTAADTSSCTTKIESQVELMRMNSGREVPVIAVNRMLKQLLFRYQGYLEAALVLGGVDKYGAHIYCIYPHGSTDKIPFATMGSGCLAAMSVFESRWRMDMNEQEAIQLVRDAIYAGITNDLGSGSNVDICVIKKDAPTADIRRTYEEVGITSEKQGNYTFRRGTTKVLKTEVFPITIDDEHVERMDED